MGSDKSLEADQRRRETPPRDSLLRVETSWCTSRPSEEHHERNRTRDGTYRRQRSLASSEHSGYYRERSRSHSRCVTDDNPRDKESNHYRRSNYAKDNSDAYQRIKWLEEELLRERLRNEEKSIQERAKRTPTPTTRNMSSHCDGMERKRARYEDQSDFFMDFINILKNRDRESYPVLNNVIPEFDPLSKEQTIDMWLSKVTECAEIYNWSDKLTVHYALPKLTGHARTWYQGLPSIKHSWEEWQCLLRKSFPSTENYAELLTEMLAKRVRPGESLELYYYAKINLLNRCKIFGKQAVDCIIFGIDDKGIRLSAQAGKFDKPEEVIEFLRSLRNHLKDHTDFKRDNHSFRDRRFTGNGPTNNSVPRNNDYLKTHSRSSAIVCFNCNTAGHPSFRCPKPIKRCSQCHFYGHNTSECPKISSKGNTINNTGQESQNKHKNVLEVSIDDNSDDKYKILVKLNGKNMFCQVDLGSQATLVREQDAHAIGLQWNSVKGPLLKGLGNVPYLPIGEVSVTIEVQGIVEYNVNVLIVKDSLINTPVLLGHSFTERPGVVIIKTDTEIQFQRAELHDSVKIALHSSEDTELEVGQLKAIPVQSNINYSGSIYVGGSVRGRSGMEHYLLPGEYRVLNDKCQLLVQNLGPNKLKFETGALISRGRNVKESPSLDILHLSVDSSDEPWDKIMCGDQLTLHEKQLCINLLQRYKDCFSSGLHDLGFTSVAEMEIQLTDTTPVVYRPYRLSFSERKHVQGMIAQMIENGIVRESSSPYASPIVLVQKKSGEKRLCVDYRALNNRTKRDHYPLPRIEDLLDQMAGQSLFTTLDLASGYYQIAIAEHSKEKTAFVTPDGQFEYNRMPFGLANAPAVFQRAIHKILSKSKVPYVVIYMDDILIPSKTFNEGLQRLEEVLALLREGGVTLKIEKCNFFQEQVHFLGFEIDKRGIRPGYHKSRAVSEFPSPKNQHDVRRFLGLAGFFRRFIRGFALIARPLTELLKKDTPWQWAEAQQSAFESLKRLLVERPILALYDHNAETQLHTDASKIGLGGILVQRTDSNPWRPVAYFSRQTNPEEQKLHSFELETLAVISALNKFRIYLLGIKFTIISDCNALRSTFTKRDLVPRISRWWIQFLEYDCNVEYRPGEKMTHVDALSRGAIAAEPEPIHTLDILTVKVDDWITTVQLADDEVKRIRDILEDSDTLKIAAVYKEYRVKNGRVFRILSNGELRWLVPRGVRWQLLKANHDDVGHFGFEKTLQRIKSLFWFPKMRRFIKKYVTACLECAHHKIPSGAKSGTLHPIPKIDIPLHTLHADHLGPFPKSKRGNIYILVIIDSFTKYVNLSAVRSTKTRATIKVFKNFFSFFGTPARLITDRGTSFTSKKFKLFIQSIGIKHILNSVATPRANGQVERYNRTILASLGAMSHNSRDDMWDTFLPDVQLSINTAVHDITKRTPTELLFGRKVGNPSQGILNNIADDVTVNDTNKSIQEIRSEASRAIIISQERNKARFDKRRKTPLCFNEGDLVRIIRPVAGGAGKSKKLETKCQGPYRIKKVLPNDRFLVVDTPLTRKGRAYEGVVSVDKIFPWMSFDAPACSSSDDSDSENL